MNTRHETPRQRAKRQKDDWRKSLSEGRVLKFDHGMRFQSYVTRAERERAYGEAVQSGMIVERVKA